MIDYFLAEVVIKHETCVQLAYAFAWRYFSLSQTIVFVSAAPEEQWNMLLIDGMTVGKGEISPEDFYSVVKKRIERTLIRTVRDHLPLLLWLSHSMVVVASIA